jgi:hypothetical protein
MVWAWGNNGNGQLGDGTTASRDSPVQVSGLRAVVGIATRGFYSLALRSDGTVWAWGYNGQGQLGDGTTAERHTPVQVSGLSGVVASSGGGSHSLVLKSDGTVWAWGYNYYGQLGDGTAVEGHSPVPSSEFSLIGGTLQVNLVPSSAISAGARWQVDGYELHNSGSVVCLSGGNHTVHFNSVAAWCSPGDQVVNISNGSASSATGTYTTGSLQVFINPQGAIDAGAQWQVDGGVWQDSGASVSGLVCGSHTVHFNSPDGWISPSDQAVNISDGTTSSVLGTYTARTRVIGVSGDLAFGSVTVGTSTQRIMTISNGGNSDLSVSSISYPTGFSVWWSGTIAAGNSADVSVSFIPQAVANYGGAVTINSDATSGDNTLAVSGTGFSCIQSLSSFSTNFVATGGSGSFTVYADAGCSWSVSRRIGWLHPSGSGTGTGTVSYTVTANNSTNSRSGTITVQDQVFAVNQAGAAPYIAWQASHFTAAERADATISGDTADPDQDGIPNLLEYALGLDPRQADVGGLPTAGMQDGYLTLTYHQNKEATDINYVVEACGDLMLAGWSTNGLSEIRRVDSSTYWGVTVRDSVSVTNAMSRFMHLKVTKP